MPEDKNKKTGKNVTTKIIASRETAIDAFTSIGALLNPDRVLEKLGLSQHEAYKDLLTDGHLTAVRESRSAAVKDMDFGIERGKGSSRQFKAVEQIFDNLDMDAFIDAVLMANDWGMSPIEVVWKAKDNFIVPVDLVAKPARWFQFDEENRLRYLSTKNMTIGEKIPDYKILLPRNRPTYDNPYGDALLSKCYWPVTFKRNAFKWWNVFIEKYAMPWIVAKVRSTIDETEADELLEKLSEMVQDGVLLIPDDDSVEFKEPDGKRSSEIFQGLAEFFNSEISKIYLGETLTTEIQDTGSYAAAKTQQGTKDERRDADVIKVERTANQLISWINEINFAEPNAPYFKMYEPKTINKSQAERDKLLSDIGVKFEPSYISTTYNIDEKDFQIGDPASGGNPGNTGGEPSENSRFKLSMFSTYPDQREIDEAVNNLSAEELTRQAQGILKPIIDLVNKSNSYSEVLDELLTTFPEMSFESGEEMIKRAIFASNAYGRIAGNAE